MRKIAPSFLFIALLSGCASTSNQDQNIATQTAITQSEKNIKQKLSQLEASTNTQSNVIANLDTAVAALRSEVLALTSALNNTKSSSAIHHDRSINDMNDKTNNTTSNNKILLGEIETVQIDNTPQNIQARIDTGAETSSLNAVDIQEFERDGKKWVKFHLFDKNTNKGDEIWIEAPVIRTVKIRQSSSESTEKRAVIELWIKLGKIHEKAQFTLADRSQMSHSVLLGREFIKDIALVDVSKKFLQSNAVIKTNKI